MNDNVIMMVCYLPEPVIFIIVGLLLWRFPAPYGDAIGYKTKLSYSSKEAWDYAQVTFGKLCTLMNIPALALSVGVGIYQVIRNTSEDVSLIICLILTTLQLVPLFVCIFITEARLKKYYGSKMK